MGLSVPKNEQELLTVSIQGEGRLPSEYILFFILFFELNIYLFNFGCIGSYLWRVGFSLVVARAPECMGSVVVAHGPSCPAACGILVPRPGIELTSPAL